MPILPVLEEPFVELVLWTWRRPWRGPPHSASHLRERLTA
jgi:hypothetical protein